MPNPNENGNENGNENENGNGNADRNIKALWRAGGLVCLRVSAFRATGALMAEDIGADPEKMKTDIVIPPRKRLFAVEMIDPLRQAETKGRDAIKRFCRPFEVGKAWYYSEASWPVLKSQLEAAKAEFSAAVETFLANYEMNRDAMIQAHPDQLKADDYPAKESLRFDFRYYRFTLAPSSAEAAAEIRTAVESFIRDSIADLRSEIVSKCRAEIGRLNDGEKRYTETNLNSLRGMIDRFRSLNFAGDASVEAALNRLRGELNLRTAKELKEGDSAKAEFSRLLTMVSDTANRTEDIDFVAAGFADRYLTLEPESVAVSADPGLDTGMDTGRSLDLSPEA